MANDALDFHDTRVGRFTNATTVFPPTPGASSQPFRRDCFLQAVAKIRQ